MKLDIYQLESNYDYNCDEYQRKRHITTLQFMKNREDQEEYMQLFDIIEK